MVKTSEKDLLQKIELAKTQVRVGGVYSHWKNPNKLYKVLEIGFCEWDETAVVVYQQLNAKNPITWVRRLTGIDGWLTKADYNGKKINRFEKIKNV